MAPQLEDLELREVYEVTVGMLEYQLTRTGDNTFELSVDGEDINEVNRQEMRKIANFLLTVEQKTR